MKRLIKGAFRWAGLNVERRDPLVESIPGDYLRSPSLPLIYRGSLDRYLYFLDQVQRVRDIEGDIVECGVSIGHGALLFQLLSGYVGKPRVY